MGVTSFSGRGGQDRARGRHLTAANTLSAFGRGCCPLSAEVAVRFRPIQPVGGGGGGGGVLSLSANSIDQVSALSADSSSARWRLSYRGVHVCKQGDGGWGGGANTGGGRH